MDIQEEEDKQTKRDEVVIHWRLFGTIGLLIGGILLWLAIGKPLYEIANGADSVSTSVKTFGLGVLLVFFSLVIIILGDRTPKYFPANQRSRWDFTRYEWLLIIALALGILVAWFFFTGYLKTQGFQA